MKLSTIFPALLFLFLAACTPHPAASPPPRFQFDFEKTTELTLWKADPTTGDRWSARFARAGEQWTIATPPENKTLGDKLANSAFIDHVLDTLRTAKSQEAPLSGSLESFGLAVPRYRLQWKGPEGEFELRIGAAGQATDRTNGESITGAYTTTDGKAVWVTTGAALEMLDRITSFDTLRQNQLLVLPEGETADDVDEITIGKPDLIFYAERSGDGWADSKKRPVDAGTFLTRLAHLRVLRFVDDEAENSKILKSPPFLKINLKDHAGHSTRIDLRKSAAQIFATVSTRPSGVFEVYPELLAWIRDL